MISSKKIYFIITNNSEYYKYILLKISYKSRLNKFMSILKQGN